jgi:phosphorylcholine metabolism protein LicD/GT2 family glycosyltransferase
MEKNIIDKKLFFKFVNLLEAHDIFFWLDFGTLLGAHREKAFIRGDDDIDVSLWSETYWLVRKIIDLSDWKYKSIWRREIAIYHESNPDFHIDLFFYDKEKDICSAYVYLENKLSKEINIESKMIVPKELLEEFKTIEFYNHDFYIPKKTGEYLTCHYGNWKDKDEKWYYSKRINIDRTHALIAIVIPTFLREDKLKNCVESLLKTFGDINRFQPWFKIYIGDQDDMNDNKKQLYDLLKELGHQVIVLPYNCGLAYSRNYLISQTKEPFILVVDDDYIFDELTNFEPMINLLLLEEKIGLVGGSLNDRITHPTRIYLDKIKQNNINRITYVTKPIKYLESKATIKQKSYRYFKSESVPNFFLAKREIFADIQWDNELKLAEHTDFFLRFKTTKWNVLFTPDTIVQHHPENNSAIYNSFRDVKTGKNCQVGLARMRQKYNLTQNNFQVESGMVENIYLTSSKIKIVQLSRIPCANSGLELSNLITKYSDIFESRYILGAEYGGKHKDIPYRQFPMDLFWQTQKTECLKILRKADIIHVHHDIIADDELIAILKTKKVIWTLYNLTQSLQYDNNSFNNNYINKCKLFSNVITVADQSLQRKMFSDVTDIKVPLVKMLFNESFERKNEIPVIAFAPTNKTESGVASKKYPQVLKIIEELKSEGYSFNFDLIEGIPYEENLDRKRKADILIDDVDPDFEKFHNTSLEAACFGAIALTNYSGIDYPFIKTNIYTLKETLIKFITNPELLKEEQRKILEWKNNNYTPSKLLKIYEQIYYDLINGKYFLKEHVILNQEQNKLPSTNITKKDIIVSIINYLNKSNIIFWLLRYSCLEALTHKEIISDKFYIGVSSVVEKNLILNQFPQYNNLLDIQVETKRNIKPGMLYGLNINVPIPVIKYLEITFKKTWKELQNDNL